MRRAGPHVCRTASDCRQRSSESWVVFLRPCRRILLSFSVPENQILALVASGKGCALRIAKKAVKLGDLHGIGDCPPPRECSEEGCLITGMLPWAAPLGDRAGLVGTRLALRRAQRINRMLSVSPFCADWHQHAAQCFRERKSRGKEMDPGKCGRLLRANCGLIYSWESQTTFDLVPRAAAIPPGPRGFSWSNLFEGLSRRALICPLSVVKPTRIKAE